MSMDVKNKEIQKIIRGKAGKEIEVFNPVRQASPFVSFHYSYKEVSSDGVNTRIKSKEKSFENGKFKSEEFEGTLPGSVYINMATEIQRLFMDQITAFLKPFSMILPPVLKNKDKK